MMAHEQSPPNVLPSINMSKKSARGFTSICCSWMSSHVAGAIRSHVLFCGHEAGQVGQV